MLEAESHFVKMPVKCVSFNHLQVSLSPSSLIFTYLRTAMCLRHAFWMTRA